MNAAGAKGPRVRLRAWAAALFVSAAWAFGATAAADYANPNGVAVIVGNRNYGHRDVHEVSYAHRDAEAFRLYVLDVLGFDPENIIDLRDASQAALETAFGNERSPNGMLWRYLDPEGGSDVVVFYSGHGVPGLSDERGYLLPADADPNTAEINGYPIDVLYANLGKLKEARSVRVFLDACFSGGSDRGMLVRSASPVFAEAELPSASRALTVLTAASGDQVASWDEAAGHGLFTHHLLDALYGAGDADGDGSVTALEAKAYLDRYMTRAARRALGRLQNAGLRGDAAAVLAAAAGGSFPERPVIDAAADSAPTRPPAAAPAAAAAAAALGLDRASRALVQRGLASLAFDPGPVDGAFGPRTRSALGAWQTAKGYEATGRLTREQAEALVAMGRDAESADRAEREREAEAAEQERLARADDDAFASALGSAPEPSRDMAAIGDYGGTLLQLLNRNAALSYPRVSMQKGEEGSVPLLLRIAPDGDLLEVRVLDDSQASRTLVSAAVRAVQRSSPFSDFATGMGNDPIEFPITVNYRLR